MGKFTVITKDFTYELLYACSRNNVSRMEELLSTTKNSSATHAGAHAAHAGADLDTLLPLAISRGQFYLARLLHSYGASAQIAAKGFSRLFHSTNNQHDTNMNIDDQNINNDCKFYTVFYNNDQQPSANLSNNEPALDFGASDDIVVAFLELEPTSFVDALNKSAKKGSMELVKWCLDQPYFSNTLAFGAAREAILGGHLDIVRCLARTDSDFFGRGSLLDTAFANKRWDIVEFLIQRGTRLPTDISGEPLVVVAVENGVREIVDLLLFYGADVNEPRKRDGATALHIAVNHGYIEIVKTLVVHGAAVNCTMNDTTTPLCVAATTGHLEMIEFLICSGASVNPLGINQLFPLFCASEAGSVDAIEFLLMRGAAIDKRYNNASPLLIACKTNNTEAVLALLSHGAAPNVPIGFEAPLLVAVEKGYGSIVSLLIQHGARVDTGCGDGTAVTLAIKTRNIEVMNILLAHGANANGMNGKVPLCKAVSMGNLNAVKTLLNHGANINGMDGMVPLCVAVQTGSQRIVKALLKRGANIEARDVAGLTPLLVAAKKQDFTLIETLLKANADVNAQNSKEATILHFAVKKENMKLMETLVEANADMTIRDKSFATPLFYAAKKGSLNFVTYLLEHGPSSDPTYTTSPLLVAVEQGHVAIVEEMLRVGVDVNCQVEGVGSPVYTAAQNGRLAVLQLLIKKGGIVTYKMENGSSPMSVAAQGGHLEVVKELMNNGADIQLAIGISSPSIALFQFLSDYDHSAPQSEVDTCSICLNVCQLPAMKTVCGHLYCLDCILELQNHNSSASCPNCRHPLEFICMLK